MNCFGYSTNGMRRHPFLQDHQGLDVEFDYDAGFAIVTTTGLAEHEMGPFDGSTGCFNPNTPTNQNRTLRIPLTPTPTDSPGVIVLDTLGPIGVWYNGVAFYNPYDGGSTEAPGNICMDPYNGHPSPDGSYHYHQYSPVPGDDGTKHSPIVGYAYDGYPVYGPWTDLAFSPPSRATPLMAAMDISMKSVAITTTQSATTWESNTVCRAKDSHGSSAAIAVSRNSRTSAAVVAVAVAAEVAEAEAEGATDVPRT